MMMLFLHSCCPNYNSACYDYEYDNCNSHTNRYPIQPETETGNIDTETQRGTEIQREKHRQR